MLESGSDRDRFWLDTMEDTISMVRIISHDRTLLLMLAGAVFALHQDMLKARARYAKLRSVQRKGASYAECTL
jgi:hypothetical protein